MGSSTRRTIAVVMATHMTCYRELLRGITAFANATASWELHHYLPVDNLARFVEQDKPQGLLLGALSNAEQGRQAVACVQRCVGVCGFPAEDGIAVTMDFESDDLRVGQVAARHFVQKGYREFAFVGRESSWSHQRGEGFRTEIESAGFGCSMLQQDSESTITGRGWDMIDRAGPLLDFLRVAPRPLALFACNDIRARSIAQMCRNEGIRVPDDVAILGCDNDDLDCEVSDPPLSSVAVPWRRIGYDAAAALDRMLDGESIEPSVILLPPIGVVERQSTDSVAVSDPDVAAAIRFIREHAHERTSVDDVLQAVPIGRRSLEKRFRAVLKRSPLEEIRRVHVERAKHLLGTTDLSVNDVARHSGFGRSTWFTEAFGALVGESPAQFRKRYQRATVYTGGAMEPVPARAAEPMGS
ncbi:MAG TPA: DNA-binding transcriptional regulator [Tepidisphaeraceae bacterium]|nr:DNA-binding transcriptional regulator [Tepidisphaeraceae bacterium]